MPKRKSAPGFRACKGFKAEQVDSAPELFEQTKVDIKIIDAAMRAMNGDGKSKELAVWRADLASGRKRELGVQRRMYCHNLIKRGKAPIDQNDRIDWGTFSPGPLPLLPPGMTESTPRHGVR